MHANLCASYVEAQAKSKAPHPLPSLAPLEPVDKEFGRSQEAGSKAQGNEQRHTLVALETTNVECQRTVGDESLGEQARPEPNADTAA